MLLRGYLLFWFVLGLVWATTNAVTGNASRSRYTLEELEASVARVNPDRAVEALLYLGDLKVDLDMAESFKAQQIEAGVLDADGYYIIH
jgi:hypothetical protein